MKCNLISKMSVLHFYLILHLLINQSISVHPCNNPFYSFPQMLSTLDTEDCGPLDKSQKKELLLDIKSNFNNWCTSLQKLYLSKWKYLNIGACFDNLLIVLANHVDSFLIYINAKNWGKNRKMAWSLKLSRNRFNNHTFGLLEAYKKY